MVESVSYLCMYIFIMLISILPHPTSGLRAKKYFNKRHIKQIEMLQLKYNTITTTQVVPVGPDAL